MHASSTHKIFHKISPLATFWQYQMNRGRNNSCSSIWNNSSHLQNIVDCLFTSALKYHQISTNLVFLWIGLLSLLLAKNLTLLIFQKTQNQSFVYDDKNKIKQTHTYIILMWRETLHWVSEMRPKWPLIGVSNLSHTLCIGVLKLTKYKEDVKYDLILLWIFPWPNPKWMYEWDFQSKGLQITNLKKIQSFKK